MDDLISRAAPPHAEVYIHPRVEPPEWFGRFGLARRIPSSADDECYLAAQQGFDNEKHLFLRRFDQAVMSRAQRETLKRYAMINRPDLPQIFELGVIEPWGFVASELIAGASLIELASRGRLSWLAATALAHDVLGHLRALRELGIDGITPARVRIALRGRVMICLGLPGLDDRSDHRITCDLLAAIFGLAATPDERAVLRGLLADETPDAIWVLCDAIVERHRELDPVLPLVLLAHAGRVEASSARAAVSADVSAAELQNLWELVTAR